MDIHYSDRNVLMWREVLFRKIVFLSCAKKFIGYNVRLSVRLFYLACNSSIDYAILKYTALQYKFTA